MAPTPVGKGNCSKCGPFLIFDPDLIVVTFNKRPALPMASCDCPVCGVAVVNTVTYKEATIFAGRGAKIRHSYDDSQDLQPITEEELMFFKDHTEEIISILLEG